MIPLRKGRTTARIKTYRGLFEGWMPRFYFDVFDGDAHKDDAGRDLADASMVAPELRKAVADVVLHSTGVTSAIINVRDEENRTVATASLSLAVSYPDTHH